MGSLNFNEEDIQFGLSNIPFGVVSTAADPVPKTATRLFGHVFKIPDLIGKGLLQSIDENIRKSLLQTTLNEFASLGRRKHQLVRQHLQKLFKSWPNSEDKELAACAIEAATVRYHLPVFVGDFSDFSCSRDHVLNAGEAVMGVRQLPPGFLHFPVGYGGRCSSIVPSGTVISRPHGQFRSGDGVSFGLSRAVDFELEVACVIGKPSSFGDPIGIKDAEDHIFGFILLNDWSARDIQGLEMNPLGPFNGKSFGTSISPWIVTADALEPFRIASSSKDAIPASYLQTEKTCDHYAIQLKVEIEVNGVSTIVCQSRFEWLYWTVNEMIAHQTINGCPLNAGDLLATGTVSGSTPDSHGCLLEITKGGKNQLTLADGTKRVYLEDGDAVRLTGWAGNPSQPQYVGFGPCYGQLSRGKSEQLSSSK